MFIVYRVWRQKYLKAMWEGAEYLSDVFSYVAMWFRDRYQKGEMSPLRGRAVRYIRTATDMGQDMSFQMGVVTRTYVDKVYPGKTELFVEVYLQDGRSLCHPLSQFHENKDDGALEYRW